MQRYHTLCNFSELYCYTVRFPAAMWSVHLKVDSIEPSISHACEIQQSLIDACTLCSYSSSRLSELKNLFVRANKAVLHAACQSALWNQTGDKD